MSIGVTEIDARTACRPSETALDGNAPFSKPSPPRGKLCVTEVLKTCLPTPKCGEYSSSVKIVTPLGRGVSGTSEWVRQERLD